MVSWRRMRRSRMKPSIDQAVKNEFMRLRRDASEEDFQWLLNYKALESRVQRYDAVSRRAVHVKEGDLPWLVVWLVGRYHPKHIRCGRRRPDVGAIRDALERFDRKVRWRWVHRYEWYASRRGQQGRCHS